MFAFERPHAQAIGTDVAIHENFQDLSKVFLVFGFYLRRPRRVHPASAVLLFSVCGTPLLVAAVAIMPLS
jgi:hypothetical protein